MIIDNAPNKCRIIGLTGPIGSGKSYIARLFKKCGIKTIDADRVYHLLTNKSTKLTEDISAAFGDSVINPDGSLNRPALATIVFGDSEKLKRLNEITHSVVIDTILKKCNACFKRGIYTVLVEVPLMFESGFDKHCTEVICVVASEQTRLKRIMKRDSLTEEQAKNRMKNQKNNDFYIEKSDKVVYNETYIGAHAGFLRVYAELFE